MRLIAIIACILVIVGLSYFLGRTSRRNRGVIVIEDSQDPEYAGKVRFEFEEDIEDLIKHKTVSMRVENRLSKKYNDDNGEPKNN